MARNSSTAGGIMKHSRSKMYSRRAQHKRTKTVTKAEKKAAGAVSEKQIGGAKNGGSRKVIRFIFLLSLLETFFRSLPSDNQNTTQLFPSEEKFKVTVKNHSANMPDHSDLALPQELSLSCSLVLSVVNALFS